MSTEDRGLVSNLVSAAFEQLYCWSVKIGGCPANHVCDTSMPLQGKSPSEHLCKPDGVVRSGLDWGRGVGSWASRRQCRGVNCPSPILALPRRCFSWPVFSSWDTRGFGFVFFLRPCDSILALAHLYKAAHVSKRLTLLSVMSHWKQRRGKPLGVTGSITFSYDFRFIISVKERYIFRNCKQYFDKPTPFHLSSKTSWSNLSIFLFDWRVS